MTTTKPLIQINDEVREMNAEEFAEYQIREQAEADRQAAIKAKLDAKAAIADRLGLTSDELALLLG